MVQLWRSTVEEIGEQRFDEALSAVLLNSHFRPSIAEIRKAAGINHGIVDPARKAAMDALGFLLAAMRIHGPQLKPLVGAILREKDDAGRVLMIPERAPNTPPPLLPLRSALALVELGLGDQKAGLDLVSGHPALPWGIPWTAETAGFRLRDRNEIETRWCEAWVRAGGRR